MSLRIYTNKKEAQANIEVIDYNDKFFDGVLLSNDEISSIVMNKIDHATYNSPTTFIGRDESLGALNKEHLSTGCKTLLNVITNPDKCFDVVECGQNALALIPLIKEGNILWEMPILHYRGNVKCDIIIHDKHFTDFRKFLSYIMN